MPAGFNKGQIEYIKTIANVNGHKSYVAKSTVAQNHAPITGTTAVCDTNLRYAVWTVGQRPLMYPTGAVDGTTNTAVDTTFTSIDVYNVPIEQDTEAAGHEERVTPECFLESVDVKMRQVTDLDETVDEQSHKEFRLIVFRHREKQHELPQHSENFSNPLYDVLFGAGSRKYGPKGFRNQMDDEGNINYDAHSGYNQFFDRHSMLTDSVNTEDYVVMKDCRYYLGREYGGKHIYEDRFHWDHEDPIVTDLADISTTTGNDKNYCWYILVLGCNNSPNSTIDNLGFIGFQSNTHVTSG